MILDGSASSDADGDPIAYDWSVVANPTGAATLSTATAAQAAAIVDVAGPTAPGHTTSTFVLVTLEASDCSDSSSAQLQLTVSCLGL